MSNEKSFTEEMRRIDPIDPVPVPVPAPAPAPAARGGVAQGADLDSEEARVFMQGIMPVLRRYHAAMREMELRFEIIDRDLSVRQHRNPIHHVESRVKDPVSIFHKLAAYGKKQTVANAERYVMDMAGVRVICSYIHDVYELRDMISRHDDLEVVTIKDYVANPKPNGYRSLHMVVRIPVHFPDHTAMLPVEVQIRTIAMDFWASLEHELKYKALSEVKGIDSFDELRDCSRIIRDVETRMQILAEALDNQSSSERASRVVGAACAVHPTATQATAHQTTGRRDSRDPSDPRAAGDARSPHATRAPGVPGASRGPGASRTPGAPRGGRASY
ncbi:GTP pyrophosphokinase [Berryella wangjianweii]|uniref:GTP pyrophosphokinase n=1 Tax=Berryella wangjianweii TaxID=2734634 RepID=UPI0028F70A24|nr:hypothetical protein [Berryella wangjianweii]